MTRARALKQAIRARAAKTGERYTTARRHLVAPAPAAPAPPASKGALSDSKTLEKTGHGLEHWFAVLDSFGAVEQGHTAAARHLHDAHQVDGWYAQGITVAYERARGVRAVNQRVDGAFEVSASKVLAGDTASVIAAFTDPRRRCQWIGSADHQLAKALSSALTDKSSKGFVVRPDGQARFRYKWDGTTVQFYLLPKAGGKVSLAVQHTKLTEARAVNERRAQWEEAFAALAAYLAR